jgi:hypothetical protein
MNTHVSYPTAILLQDKGINIWSEYRYTDFNGIERLEKEASEIFPYAPTIADVVMRLYEKHGIWIVAWKNPDNSSQFYFEIDTPVKRIGDLSLGLFNSPTEAYEAAITYVLENLI